MNQQEFAAKVGELATRIGYPMPSVDWSSDKKYHDRGVVLDPNTAFGPTLHVHYCAENSMPAEVREFLVAQEFVQARLGVWRHRRLMKNLVLVVAGVLGFVVVVATAGTTSFSVAAFLAGCAVAWVSITAIQIGIVAVWSRWFVRRADRQLVEVLGRERVVSALGWWVRIGWRPSVRWLLNGATPTAKERLRRLDAFISD